MLQLQLQDNKYRFTGLDPAHNLKLNPYLLAHLQYLQQYLQSFLQQFKLCTPNLVQLVLQVLQVLQVQLDELARQETLQILAQPPQLAQLMVKRGTTTPLENSISTTARTGLKLELTHFHTQVLQVSRVRQALQVLQVFKVFKVSREQRVPKVYKVLRVQLEFREYRVSQEQQVLKVYKV
jgi:hypothetical protein